MFFQLVFWVFIGATAVQLAFWLLVFSRLAWRRIPEENGTEEEPSVSVIICARNEAENLKKNLPRILNQNYRSFEVVVVNDGSTDETANILLEFNIKHSNLHTVATNDKPAHMVGKKYALAKGIDTAKHDVLLVTDADCQPLDNGWIRQMQGAIRGAKTIGLGYSPYEKRPGFLNRYIRFETVYTAVQYFSFALIGMPYMGVGRNLIYRKHLFQQVNGFQKHAHIASGDDDLFINAVATPQNVAIVLNPASFVVSTPKLDWQSYAKQKTRHYTTGKHYRPTHQLMLGALSLSHFLHYFGGIVLILKISTMFASIFLIGLRILILMYFYRLILKKLHAQDILPWIPLMDIIMLGHYLVFTPSLLTGKTNSWK
ncbi:MAG: glycosyltransferase [Bacteroidota bacterium]